MYWKFDWFWGLPLLVITVVFHVVMFVLMEKTLVIKVGREEDTRTLSHFIVAMALIALGAATLHGLEATAWAALYIWLGALPDPTAARKLRSALDLGTPFRSLAAIAANGR